jgi:hypothetical protein
VLTRRILLGAEERGAEVLAGEQRYLKVGALFLDRPPHGFLGLPDAVLHGVLVQNLAAGGGGVAAAGGEEDLQRLPQPCAVLVVDRQGAENAPYGRMRAVHTTLALLVRLVWVSSAPFGWPVVPEV